MRLIDADAMKHFLCKCCNILRSEEPCEPSECDVWAVIDEQPTVDAVPVVHGWWEDMDIDPKCSVCGKFAVNDKHAVKYYEYCPHCGAKMDHE